MSLWELDKSSISANASAFEIVEEALQEKEKEASVSSENAEILEIEQVKEEEISVQIKE